MFFASAAVLVLEILAGRLLAPLRRGPPRDVHRRHRDRPGRDLHRHLGRGASWPTGSTPAGLVGPLLAGGGVLAMLSVRHRAHRRVGGQRRVGQTLGLTLLGFFPSAAVLSAPFRLSSSNCSYVTSNTPVRWWGDSPPRDGRGHRGHLRGRLRAGGRGRHQHGDPHRRRVAGRRRPRPLGRLARPRPPAAAWPWPRVALGAAGLAATSDGPCDVETRYHCARVMPDPAPRERPVAVPRHPPAQLRRPDDPPHLELRYSKGSPT